VFKLGALLPLTGGFSSYAKLAQCATNLAIEVAVVIVSFEDDGTIVLKAIGQDPVLSKARLIGMEGMAFSPS
jgi:hypothetical protein